MQDEKAQTVILYRQGEQDFVTFGNGEPVEVRVADGIPINLKVTVDHETKELPPKQNYVVIEDDVSAQDSLHYAQQLGRLDLVSLVLTALGLIIAIAALVGFYQVSRVVRAIAKEEVITLVPSEAHSKTEEFLESNGKTLVHEKFSEFLSSQNARTVFAEIINKPEMIAMIAAQIKETGMDKTREAMTSDFDIRNTTIAKDLSGMPQGTETKWDDQDG